MLLMGRPEGKSPGCRYVDNIKMDLREVELCGMDRIDLAQDRGLVERSCKHSNEPSGFIKC
jgi:hypothetical protein